MGTLTQTLSLRLTSAPANEPVTLDEVKAQLRIAGEDSPPPEDDLLNRLIKVARAELEALTGLSFVTQTYVWTIEALCDEMFFPTRPVQSVDSITYLDSDGQRQTLSSSLYEVDVDSDTPRIVRAYNASYPSQRRRFNNVKITFVAGYGDESTDVPEDIRHALLLTIGARDLYREDMQPVIRGTDFQALPRGAQALLMPYRMIGF